MSGNPSSFFDNYDWHADELEPGIWRSSFATDAGGEFDLFVMAGEEWVHFAVSPFTPRPVDACRGRLFEALLILNQQMRLAHFGLDGDGDVNLLLELPTIGFDFAQFELALDTLGHYTEELGGELARLATDARVSFGEGDEERELRAED